MYANKSNVLNEFRQPDKTGDNLAIFNGTFVKNGTKVEATGAEINAVADDSGNLETLSSAGAISITKRNTNLALDGTGAITLDACPASMNGKIKKIEMTADNGDVSFALTNVQGQSSGTTATFNDVGDALILIGASNGKWTVVKELGITLA